MTAGAGCKSTVHFSTSFSTTSTLFPKNDCAFVQGLDTLGFAISFTTSASVAIADSRVNLEQANHFLA